MRVGYKWLLLIIGLAAVTTNSISGFMSNDPLLSTIHQQLAQGNVVVVYQMENDDKGSEQYADWASYLNDFYSTNTDNYRVYRTNKVLNDILVINKIDVTDSYTLFMKYGSPSYFYQGAIVEAMVYFAVDQAYSGQSADGLEAFLPDEVQVQF